MRLHLERRADSKREVRRRAGYGGSEAGVRLPLCHLRGAAPGGGGLVRGDRAATVEQQGLMSSVRIRIQRRDSALQYLSIQIASNSPGNG
jgi:hypothetical protein